MRLINLSNQANKFFDTLPAKQFKQIVKEIFTLAKTPQQPDISKLKGTTEFYRKDIGEYRIIYKYDVAIIYITIIGKRNYAVKNMANLKNYCHSGLKLKVY